MNIEQYIQAGLQHFGIYSESLTNFIYALILIVIMVVIGSIVYIIAKNGWQKS